MRIAFCSLSNTGSDANKDSAVYAFTPWTLGCRFLPIGPLCAQFDRPDPGRRSSPARIREQQTPVPGAAGLGNISRAGIAQQLRLSRIRMAVSLAIIPYVSPQSRPSCAAGPPPSPARSGGTRKSRPRREARCRTPAHSTMPRAQSIAKPGPSRGSNAAATCTR